jgi:monoterpene epsilon-lactone hydrolase
MWHVWQIAAPWMPEASGAIQHIGRFIRQHVQSRPQAA